MRALYLALVAVGAYGQNAIVDVPAATRTINTYDVGVAPNSALLGDNVFGGAAVKDGANGTPGTKSANYDPGCYAKFGTRAASPEFMYGASRNNMAKCKEICLATSNTEACNLVAYAESTCEKGEARISDDDNDCHPCVTDEHFRRGQGCGYECNTISCAHSQADGEHHTCPSQARYEDATHDDTKTRTLDWATNKFAFASHLNPVHGDATAVQRSDIGNDQSNCADATGFHSTRTTYPRGRGSHFTPDKDEAGNNLHRTQETVCVMGFNGHKCKVGAFGICKCYPTKKPLSL